MTPSPIYFISPLALSACAGKAKDCSQCEPKDGSFGSSHLVLPLVVVGFYSSVRVDDRQTTDATDATDS